MSDTVAEVIADYDRGRRTHTETMLRLIPAVADSDGGLESLSESWRSKVLEELDKSPTTDEAWASVRLFQIGGYTSEESFQWVQERNRKLLEHYRHGVEKLRQLISDAAED